MKFPFVRSKKQDTQHQAVSKAVARLSKTLSVFGRGPVLDWCAVLGVGAVLFSFFLWHGWYLYGVQSKKEFGPAVVEATQTTSHADVLNVLEFVEMRTARRTQPATTTMPVPTTPQQTPNQQQDEREGEVSVPGLR